MGKKKTTISEQLQSKIRPDAKARYWWGVFWPENLEEDWEIKLGDKVALPFAYCIHDADVDTKGKPRRKHGHFLVAFKNTTTYKHALDIFKIVFGEKAVNTIQPVINIRHAFDYLIHDTESCRKQGKHQYDASCRITGNGFDIGMYEQTSVVDKEKKLDEMIMFILDGGYLDMGEAYLALRQKFKEDCVAREVWRTYNSILDRMVKANYSKYCRQRDQEIARQEQRERDNDWRDLQQSVAEMNAIELVEENERLRAELIELKQAQNCGENGANEGESVDENAYIFGHTTKNIRDGRRKTDSKTPDQKVMNNNYLSNSDTENTPQTHPKTHPKTHPENLSEFCPHCGSDWMKKMGKTRYGTQRYLCKECGKSFSQTIGTEKRRE